MKADSHHRRHSAADPDIGISKKTFNGNRITRWIYVRLYNLKN